MAPLAQEWRGNRLAYTWGASSSTAQPFRGPVAHLTELLSKTFLPEGYPHSVSSDYLGFQAWDTVQAICSYVRGMLSSQAIMHGIGVGQAAATAYGAVFLFAVRDLTGMIGGLVFAHLEGSSFDSCAKQWRLFADVANDIALAVDLASPLFPKAFLLMACVASLARAVTGVAGGATRAALTQHFAQQGNAADVAAKEQSQETAVTAAGMVLGMLLTRLCSSSHAMAWLAFSLLTALHVWANVRAMRCLVLTSVNQPRLDALLEAYTLKGTVPTPVEMSAAEDLMPPPFKRLLARMLFARGAPRRTVQLGTSLRKAAAAAAATAAASSGGQGKAMAAASGQDEAAVRRLLKAQGQRRHLVVGSRPGSNAWATHCSYPPVIRYLVVDAGTQVLAVLHRDADAEDVLHAYVHAWKVCNGSAAGTQAEAWMQEHFQTLVTKLKAAGWQLTRVALPQAGFTASWQIPSHKD